jgi:hypothetical protein
VSTTLPTSSRRPLWRTLLLAALIFIAGGITGGATAAIVIARRIQVVIKSPELLPDRLTSRLTRHLDLTEAEQARVHATLVKHQPRLMELRREMQPKVMAELDQIRIDIGAEIDPSRRAKLDATYESFLDNFVPPLPPTARP